MAPILRVLFYDDAPDFGGHELQTLAALRHMVAQPNTEAGFIYFRGNARLAKHITELAAQYPRFSALPQDDASGSFQFLRTLVSFGAIRRVAAAMAAYKPDIVVLAQGAIAFGSVGLLAARKAGLPTISYIPMTHPERFFSASRWKAALREPVNRFYYRLPDAYITVSPRMAGYLKGKGLTQPVTVVPAAMDPSGLRPVDPTAARLSLQLAPGDRVAALIGRVQFWQKRQDLAVQALALVRQHSPNFKLLVVGDGPDLPALKALVHAQGLDRAVVFAGWSDNLAVVYAAMDMLLIPSRYEGVPLVMLEAMYSRRPVVATDVDGMADILPPHWLFPSGDAAALAAGLLQAARASESELLDAHHQRIVSEHSMVVFERRFMAAVSATAKRLRPGLASSP